MWYVCLTSAENKLSFIKGSDIILMDIRCYLYDSLYHSLHLFLHSSRVGWTFFSLYISMTCCTNSPRLLHVVENLLAATCPSRHRSPQRYKKLCGPTRSSTLWASNLQNCHSPYIIIRSFRIWSIILDTQRLRFQRFQNRILLITFPPDECRLLRGCW